jgi:hypothetical protein
MEIKHITQTCNACPSQWEGRSTDNRPVYIRYRWGWLTIGVGLPGQTISDAVEKSMNKPDVEEKLGDEFHGEISYSKVKPYIDKLAILQESQK